MWFIWCCSLKALNYRSSLTLIWHLILRWNYELASNTEFPIFCAGFHVMVWGWYMVALKVAAALEADEPAPSVHQDAHSLSWCQQVLLPVFPCILRPPASAHPSPPAPGSPCVPAAAPTPGQTCTSRPWLNLHLTAQVDSYRVQPCWGHRLGRMDKEELRRAARIHGERSY